MAAGGENGWGNAGVLKSQFGGGSARAGRKFKKMNFRKADFLA